MNDELLDINGASEFLKVSTRTITALKQKGKIPFHRIGVRVVFSREELLEWVKTDKSSN